MQKHIPTIARFMAILLLVAAIMVTSAAHIHPAAAHLAMFTVPSCTASGFGTNATCTVDPGSGDDFGSMTIATGLQNTVGDVGRIRLNFAGIFGTSEPVCIFEFLNGSGQYGAGRWPTGSTTNINAQSEQFVEVNWWSNGVGLASSTYQAKYRLNYHCDPR